MVVVVKGFGGCESSVNKNYFANNGTRRVADYRYGIVISFLSWWIYCGESL